MGSGYYAASTALIARTQALDTIANNLANASTVGFRAEHNVFKSVLADAGNASATALNQAVNDYSVLGGTNLDLGQGAMQKTGNDLDVGIQGSGFFAIQTANGPMYTRDGAFQVSSTGQLVTSTGDAVMGDKGILSIPPGPVSSIPDRHAPDQRGQPLLFRSCEKRDTVDRFNGAAGGPGKLERESHLQHG